MTKHIYKTIDLFGNEQTHFAERVKEKPNLFTDYEGFVQKFEPKKTTDDCYTPPEVFKIVLDYVAANYDLTGKNIIRPFFPGGDYQAIEYGPNDVVIDNPPFSIITPIARYYIERGVPFFLFAPHLTLFVADIDCTHIVVGGNIIYENGANVKTSFLSNMFGNAKIIGEPDLYAKFCELEERSKVRLPKYEYPLNVLTVSHISWIIERGIPLRFNKQSVKHYRQMDAQKPHKKAIFGSGFIISDAAAAEKAAAEKAAEEAGKMQAEKAEQARKENIIVWPLSDRERDIINALE
jgi:hypothetical protein